LVAGSTTGDGTIVIHDDDVGGDATVTIQAVDALVTGYTLTLPPNDGDAGQQLTSDGSGVTTWEAAGAVTYDIIGDPAASGSISFDAAETAEYTSAFTANDFMTIKGTGAFGDYSVLTVTQDTGDPTDGDLIHAYTADGEDNVDQLVLGNGTDDYLAIRVIEAGTVTFDIVSDGTPALVVNDASTFNSTMNIIGATTLGTATSAAGNLSLYDAGTLTLYEDGDNFNITLACADGEAVGTLTGGLDVTGLLEAQAGLTVATTTAFSLGANQIDNGSDLLDGEMIADNTIDNDSIDFGDMTDLGDDGVVIWGNVGAGELGNDSVINEDIDDDGGFIFTGAWDFGGGDLEIPQASPGVPGADGGIEMDFTDGKLVMQHGSAHAELAGSTDVAMASLIHSWSGTFGMPDSLQTEIDNWPFKRIDATEFPHGVVITSITLTVSGDTSYTINVENWDDHDTINGANPTIDAVAYTAPSTGEVTESTITYDTIAAGQIIMIDLPTTDVSWINIVIEYYEPAA